MGKLYIVPTPIGNLRDITLRALDILKEVNFIACEDTRRTRILLNHYGIENKKLISYYEPKEEKQIPRIMKILEGEDVALVTDAGMPGVSDPGFRLVRQCIDKGVEVEVLPGPSAFLTALVGSGLPTDRFLFAGFPPKKGTRGFLEDLRRCGEATIILYESPRRVLRTLELIADIFGNVQVCLARELTKIHEEFIRGRIFEVMEKLRERGTLRGEVVILFTEKGGS